MINYYMKKNHFVEISIKFIFVKIYFYIHMYNLLIELKINKMNT